ncbi:MAG: mechanosensitive ion channel family protein [Verrucomicrobia bacterium]|nr:mechanosensitive ion channel family protein [Verrucomicrobiota bacterium]
MKRFFLFVLCSLTLAATAPVSRAQSDPTPPADPATPAETSGEDHHHPAAKPATAHQDEMAAQAATTTAAVAAVAAQKNPAVVRTPDFLEHLVDTVLELFNVRSSGNTTTHYVISALFFVGAILLRRVVTGIIFKWLKKFAEKTETTLDDKLFPALESPVATFVMVTGIFAALKVLKLSETADRSISYGSTVAFSLVLFWGLLRAFGAIIDHAAEVAREKQLGIAAFMPWIKKTLITVFVVIGVLLTAQSLGADVKAFLAGLGIGGLAFALAAQDTIANLFGSIVVAIDQPFKVGEAVQIGSTVGIVEDIGLRSTKIRKLDKALVIIPNKAVASESITNLSRFTARRVEQTLGLTYDTKPAQMEAVLQDIREAIQAEPEVDKNSVVVAFTNFGASSLDVLVVYMTLSPDFLPHLKLKERLNLKFMQVVAARGLGFAFPTQTVQLDGEIARKLVEKK